MWSRFIKLSQIEYHDKRSLLTVIQASIDFYDVIKTIQNSVQGIFSEIMATTSRLNTFYRIETSYGHSSRHFRITENVLRHFRRFWRINDVINVGFLCDFAVFGYDKCQKNIDTLDFYLEYVLWEDLPFCNVWNLQSLMCNWHCLVELIYYNRRVLFPVLRLLKWRTFNLTSPISPIIMIL